MAQVKIYGLQHSLNDKRKVLSNAIHKSLMEAFELPKDKMFHRYFLLNSEDFIFPSDRSENYTIIELSIFEGRSIEAKKLLIKLLNENIYNLTKIQPQDIEITIHESPKCNWGIRGVPGDELVLNYRIEI